MPPIDRNTPRSTAVRDCVYHRRAVDGSISKSPSAISCRHDWQDFPRAKRSVSVAQKPDRWPIFSLLGVASRNRPSRPCSAARAWQYTTLKQHHSREKSHVANASCCFAALGSQFNGWWPPILRDSISLPSTDTGECKFIGGFGTAHPRAVRLGLRTDQVRISSQERYTHDEEVGLDRSYLR